MAIIKKFFIRFRVSSSPSTDPIEKSICPILFLAMTISLKGTDTKDLHRCQKKIEDFIEENVLRAVRIPCAFSSDAWNQSMINVFYQFCLDHRVLPRWNRNLELIGTTNGVEKAKEKYRWLARISQLRPQSRVKVLQSKQVNLLLSCSSEDQQRSMSLAHRLVEEEFLVAIDYSDQRRLSLIADVGQTDLILICFSWNYFNNFNCKTVLDMIQSSTKKFIPILFPPAEGDNCWLETMMVEDAFYQTFQKQIRFRLNDNVDSLLGELVSDQQSSKEMFDFSSFSFSFDTPNPVLLVELIR